MSGSRSRTRSCPSSSRSDIRSRFGDDFLRLGYLKVFMDGTLGSQTAWMLDGSGVRITSGEELAEIVRRGRARRLAGRGARDRRPREPRGARRVRVDEGRMGAARACGSGSSTRSVSRPRISVASPSSVSPARCSSRTLLPTAIWRSASGPTGSRAPTPSARCLRPVQCSRTARTRRSRSSIHWPGSGRRSLARSTSDRAGAWTRR